MARPEPHELPLLVENFGESGDPIILLHGFGACGFSWRYWVPELARNHRVHVIEWKLFEPGSEPPDYHTPTGQAELIHALIVRKNLRRVTLIGHSLGGGIALLTALRLLDEGAGRLQSIVLIGGAAYAQQIPPFISLARIPLLGETVLRVLPSRWIVRLVLRFIRFDRKGVTQNQVEAYSKILQSRAGRYGLVQLARNILPDDTDILTQRYREIDVPALLLWGGDDPVVPVKIGQRLKRELPNAELVVIERMGHLPAEERPDESLAHVERFLERVAGERQRT